MLNFSKILDSLNNDFVKTSKNVPKHVAFIMDGNRRYSKTKNIPRKLAYSLGAKNLINLISASYSYSIKEISFYTFSLDNFGRCLDEQNEIFQSLKEELEENVIDKISTFKKLGIYIKFIGETALLPEEMQKLGHKLENFTRPSHQKNLKLIVNINIEYSGLNEIFKIAKNLVHRLELGQMNKDELNLKIFEDNFYSNKSLPVDLMIRTSGEVRKSDFLIWQSSESILYMVEKLWPDFNQLDLFKAIFYYQQKSF